MKLTTLHLYTERLRLLAEGVEAHIAKRDYYRAMNESAEASTVAKKIYYAAMQRTRQGKEPPHEPTA